MENLGSSQRRIKLTLMIKSGKSRNFSKYLKDISAGTGKIIEISGVKVALYKHDQRRRLLSKTVMSAYGMFIKI